MENRKNKNYSVWDDVDDEEHNMYAEDILNPGGFCYSPITLRYCMGIDRSLGEGIGNWKVWCDRVRIHEEGCVYVEAKKAELLKKEQIKQPHLEQYIAIRTPIDWNEQETEGDSWSRP